VGGGSGGCAVAGRLSEDPKTSVALPDAGGKNDNWVVTTPFALVLMVAGNVNNWAFNAVPQKGLNGRIGYQPRGEGLGGSSAINAMVYVRGHRSDYDQWASLGNTGCSFADVLPYFKPAEDNADFAGDKTTRRLMETPALRALQKNEMFTAGVTTDDDIRAVPRARVDTVYHPVGTTKMGVSDPMAVVDPKLKVHGVEGLRVVDASVMPTPIGGSTNATGSRFRHAR